MMSSRRMSSLYVLLTILALQADGKKAEKLKAKAESSTDGQMILWRDPTDIASRDLFYGPGGKEHVPHGTFTFVKEDMAGTNPKFDVRDQDGMKWKVKLGVEARPENVASRLVWAVGYNANEDYFLPAITVSGMPAHLRRGQNLVHSEGSMQNVRLKREPKEEKKIGNWKWQDDPFVGTREWNGLKVVMALINNWDLKTPNNAIYREDDKRIFMVSDLGSSFGATGLTWPLTKAKDNFDSFSHSRFILKSTPERIEFQVVARPVWPYLLAPVLYLKPIHLQVPRADAHWMGLLLARLSQDQIRDAFRASGYSPQEVDEFSGVVGQRIAVLTAL